MKYLYMLPPAPSAPDHVKMMHAFSRLPEVERTVLTLYYHEELSLEQIAEVVERSEDDAAAYFYWGHVDAGLRLHLPALAHASS
jgi:hypothetical protein